MFQSEESNPVLARYSPALGLIEAELRILPREYAPGLAKGWINCHEGR